MSFMKKNDVLAIIPGTNTNIFLSEHVPYIINNLTENGDYEVYNSYGLTSIVPRENAVPYVFDTKLVPEPLPTQKYRHFNHYHEMTDNHTMVDFGHGEFIANNQAIPLLQALARLGFRTRTHHIDDKGGFVSILLDPHIDVEFNMVHEHDRTTYNGQRELLLRWSPPKT